jgi:hypothetical protein
MLKILQKYHPARITGFTRVPTRVRGRVENEKLGTPEPVPRFYPIPGNLLRVYTPTICKLVRWPLKMDTNTQNINISVEIRVATNKWSLITWREFA